MRSSARSSFTTRKRTARRRRSWITCWPLSAASCCGGDGSPRAWRLAASVCASVKLKTAIGKTSSECPPAEAGGSTSWTHASSLRVVATMRPMPSSARSSPMNSSPVTSSSVTRSMVGARPASMSSALSGRVAPNTMPCNTGQEHEVGRRMCRRSTMARTPPPIASAGRGSTRKVRPCARTARSRECRIWRRASQRCSICERMRRILSRLCPRSIVPVIPWSSMTMLISVAA
mmetsp:Transcript_15204/g.39507  ORF Transcript_15204/g.39507 Transcript_15204/m.39507 type:complete len:232 (+) Transcript_15204:172-867(+)